MFVTFGSSIVSKRLDPQRDLFRVCRDRSGITFCAKIFRRIKTERAQFAEDAGALPVPKSAMRMGGVFEKMDLCCFTKTRPAFHFADLSIQMHQQDRFCPRR